MLIACLYVYLRMAMLTVIAFVIGCVLMVLAQSSLCNQHDADANMFLGLLGLFVCGTTSLFESLYFTNRDVKYWVTINNSAVPAVLIISAGVILILKN